MKKLTYLVSLLAMLLVFSSFTDAVAYKKDKTEKNKTEKVKKDKKQDKKEGKKKGKKARKAVVEDTITNPIWAFGFSASFTDSLIYMTDMQEIPNVKLTKKTHFVEDRAIYADQMKNYLESKMGLKNRVCVMFYETDKKKAEKLYVEVRKRYTDQTHLTLNYLNATEFRFTKPE